MVGRRSAQAGGPASRGSRCLQRRRRGPVAAPLGLQGRQIARLIARAVPHGLTVWDYMPTPCQVCEDCKGPARRSEVVDDEYRTRPSCGGSLSHIICFGKGRAHGPARPPGDQAGYDGSALIQAQDPRAILRWMLPKTPPSDVCRIARIRRRLTYRPL